MPAAVMAEEATGAAPESPHSFSYNIGLASQYIFRGLTQTGEEPALQGGVDYAHASGFYLGTWGSNISWLEDAGAYDNSSLEVDVYGGYASTFGDTGIDYNVGLLQYLYPGSRNSGVKTANTTEVYGSLGYKWVTGKVSVVVSDSAFGYDDGDGSWYAELNGDVPLGESGYSIIAHVGRQEFEGSGNDTFNYTDWKLGLTKAWDNGVTVGGYYTDTNGSKSDFTDASGQNLAEDQFTVFVQKTF
jgi:uncharacterized protein (TIGR02001 family)